jgi:hypothetical protein
MSRGHDDRVKLARLADAFMQDVLATPDDEIIAEVGQERLGRVRTILIEVKATVAKRALARARDAREAWTASRSADVVSFDRAATQSQFEQLRRRDPAFNHKMMLAARNGKAPTEDDIEGLIGDLEDLKRLDGKDKPE